MRVSLDTPVIAKFYPRCHQGAGEATPDWSQTPVGSEGKLS